MGAPKATINIVLGPRSASVWAARHSFAITQPSLSQQLLPGHCPNHIPCFTLLPDTLLVGQPHSSDFGLHRWSFFFSFCWTSPPSILKHDVLCFPIFQGYIKKTKNHRKNRPLRGARGLGLVMFEFVQLEGGNLEFLDCHFSSIFLFFFRFCRFCQSSQEQASSFFFSMCFSPPRPIETLSLFLSISSLSPVCAFCRFLRAIRLFGLALPPVCTVSLDFSSAAW